MGYQTWIDDTTGKAYSDLQKTISSSIQGVASSFIQRIDKLKQDAKEAEEQDYKVQENTLALRTKIGDAFKEGSNGVNMQEAFNPVIDRIAQLNLKRLRHKLTDKEITQLAVLNNTISGAKDEIATLGAAGTSYVEAKSKAPGTAGAWSRTNDDKDPSAQFLRAGTNIDSTVEDVVRTLKIDLETGQRTWGAKAKAKNLITGEIEEIGGEINGNRLTQLMQPGNSGLFTTVPDYIKSREALIAGSSGEGGIFYSKAEADKLGNPDLTGKIKDPYLDKKNATIVKNKGDNGSTISYNTYNANAEFIKSNQLLNTNINATINSMSLADKKAFVRDITGQTDCTDAELNSQIKDYYIQSLTKDKTPEYNMIGGAAGIVTNTIAAPKDKELESGPTDPNNPNKNIALSGKQSGKYIGIKLDPARATALRKQASKIIKDVGGTMQVRYYNADTQNINTLKLKYNAANGGLVDEDGNNITRADLEALIGIK
jgi:hypothetical protein